MTPSTLKAASMLGQMQRRASKRIPPVAANDRRPRLPTLAIASGDDALRQAPLDYAPDGHFDRRPGTPKRCLKCWLLLAGLSLCLAAALVKLAAMLWVLS